MSSTLPPSGPPYEPPHEPVGAPQPEILDHSDGATITEQGKRGGGRKTGLLLGGGVLALALVGGGAWAAMSFLATGDQPAEALPATALGYVSIDLDPSGAQKIEAVRTLNKFPAFKDSVGISPEGDLRKAIVEDALEGEDCDVSYGDDIEPWLGDRAAVAAVPDADGPQPIVVLQVTDAGAAEAGLQAIKACGGDGDQDTAWVIEGDWAVIAPTQALAQSTVDAAGTASLADDEDYQRWTAEAGDPGVVTMYAAPAAGAAIAAELGDDAPAGTAEQLADFEGAAATIRFTDGSLELAGAGNTLKDAAGVIGDANVADSVATLPDDTAAVLGLSLGEGWFDKAFDAYATELGGGDDILAQIEGATGLTLPDDIETLTQGGLVLAVGSGLDPEAIVNASDPSAIPVALKLTGDPDKIQSVISKLLTAVPGGDQLVGTSVDGDTVVLGPDPEFRDLLTKDGGLGDAATFTDVVPNADSPGVFYVNVDAFDAALESLAAGDEEILANVKPLRAVGVSSSVDGDVVRFTLRVSTDD